MPHSLSSQSARSLPGQTHRRWIPSGRALLAVGVALIAAPITAVLVTRSDGEAPAPRAAPGATAGQEWEWIGRATSTGGESLAIDEPHRYVLRLEDDGTASLRAGCNWTAGTYDSSTGALDIRAGLGSPSTCPASPHSGLLLEAMVGRASYRIDGRGFLIVTTASGGELEFRPSESQSASGETE